MVILGVTVNGEEAWSKGGGLFLGAVRTAVVVLRDHGWKSDFFLRLGDSRWECTIRIVRIFTLDSAPRDVPSVRKQGRGDGVEKGCAVRCK